MKSWRGLIWKEWLLLRWGVGLIAVLSFFVILGGPLAIQKLLGVPGSYFSHALVFGGTWIVLHLFVGLFLLFTSLGNEMKQPEIWLHSPVPMAGLVGAKVAFASIVTTASLLWNGLLLGIAFYVSEGGGTIPFEEGVLPLLSVMVALFLRSLFVMGLGFFFWSVYQVLHSRIGKFLGATASYIIFFLSTILWEKVRVSGILDSLKAFGPVKWTDAAFFNESDSYFFMGIVPEGVVFTIGGLLVYGAVTVVLFMAGGVLFEKKVRL
ncbi:hypothetical protein OXB_0795 [Bacillus sp. OxB-1]|uniref:hypothetical protein n=1 Tax=Bacillus sp. (strain OxB-1) TaxID=98228 RepID=UPI000581C0DC|nr:hypothetical protein [Bacillus sp. OxB-1]BAQ09267.1 hypothetical protein OXB_0795 [Bacillus sp. OxB-1]